MTTLRRRTKSEREHEPSSATYEETYESYADSLALYNQCSMACRDRTAEFRTVVRNKEGRLMNGMIGPTDAKRRNIKDVEGWNRFMQIASQIGKDISHTYAKLEKLTLLAKKRSLFDDKPVEIQELTLIIKEDINNLNKQILQLQQVSKSRNSNQGKHMLSHSNSVVVSLQSKLANMSEDFKHVLEVRTENLRHERARRSEFGTAVHSPMPASNSQLLFEEQHEKKTECSIDMSSSQQQMMLIDEQDSYIQSRADTMENIEATIVELGTIFQQLAHMVKEQEEVVQRIDSNVEDAQLNVEAAHSEILKYFQSVTSNRWLMVKVFAVLILFFIIFVVFVA